MNQPVPSQQEALPPWYAVLSLRANADVVPDQDLKECLDYVDSLRRQRERLLADLATARINKPASLPILDRFEAVLGYVSAALADAPLEAVPYLQGVAARLNGRES